MEAFLSKTKKELSELASFSKINVVLGNESCDLDSAVSSIVYAFYLSQKEDNPLTPCIPCFNINQEDLALRTEAVYYLEKNGINLSNLTYRDQIDLDELHKNKRLRLHLVDHNTLPGNDSDLEGAVVEVVDHHNFIGDDAPDGVIEPVGSCSTLVAEHMLGEDRDWVSQNVDETIAKLLIGTILFDTVKLSESAGRVTPKDVKMVEDLQKFCPNINKDEVYQEIHNAKFDVAGLSMLDLLRKDFKTVSSRRADNTTENIIGISSITIEMEKILQRSGMRDDFESFCTSRNLKALIIMTISMDSDGTPERWLLMYNPGDSICHNLIRTLKEDQQLQLSVLTEEEEGVTLFKQENSKVSRKIVMPVLQMFLDTAISDQDDLLGGNFNNSALVDFSGGGEASSNFMDFDPFGSTTTTSFEDQVASSGNNDPFGDLVGGAEGSANFSFDPFATITEDDPSFTSPKSPLSPSGQQAPIDLLGMDPFAPSEQLLNVQEGVSDMFDPFQTISPSSDSFNSQEDLLGAPPAQADPFDLFTNSNIQNSSPVTSTDPFDIFTNTDSIKSTEPFANVSEDHESANSFEFVEKVDCEDESSQAIPILGMPKNVPPTPQNSYADMSELNVNKEFDHNELFQKVQKLDSDSSDNIIVFSSNSNGVEENGFERSINGLHDVKAEIQVDENNQQEKPIATFGNGSVNIINEDDHEIGEKSSPTDNEISDSANSSNKSRTISCGSEGSASYTDDLSDSSSGDSYSLNETPQYASHHVITEIQEEDEEEEERNEYMVERNNLNNFNMAASNNASSIPAIVIDEVHKRSQSVEEFEVPMPYIVVEEVENMNFSDGDEEIIAQHAEKDDAEVNNAEMSHDIIGSSEEKPSSNLQRVDSEAVEEYVEHIVDAAVDTLNNEHDSSTTLVRVDSKAVEEYVEHVVDAAANSISKEVPSTNELIFNDKVLSENLPAALVRVDSEAVEEYVEDVVDAAANSISKEVSSTNELIFNDKLQSENLPAALVRVDSEAVEEYVEHVVDAAANSISKEVPSTNELLFNDKLQSENLPAPLVRVDSEAVEEYVEHVVDAAANSISKEVPSTNELIFNDKVQSENLPVALVRVDSEAVEEYVEDVVDAAANSISKEVPSTNEIIFNDKVQSENLPAPLVRVDSEAVEEYVEHVVDAAANSLSKEVPPTNELIFNDKLQSENLPAPLVRVDSEAVEEYVEDVVDSAANSISKEVPSTNEIIFNDKVQSANLPAPLVRVDSEAVEEYVEHVVDAAANSISKEVPSTNEIIFNDKVQSENLPAALVRVDSEAVEEYVEHVVDAAANSISKEVPSTNEIIFNDKVQSENLPAALVRVDSEAVEEYVEHVVDAAANSISKENITVTELCNNEPLLPEKAAPELERIDSTAVEEYVENIVDAAANLINKEDAVNNPICNEQDLQEPPAKLEKIGSEAVEEYVENVIGAAVTQPKNIDQDLQTKESSSILQRIDSDAEYVGNVVEAAQIQTALKKDENDLKQNIDIEDSYREVVSSVIQNSELIQGRNESEADQLLVERIASIDELEKQQKISNVDLSSDENSLDGRDNLDRDDMVQSIVKESDEVLVSQTASLVQSMPPDSSDVDQSKKNSPTEHKKVLALPMDLDLDDEEVDNENVKRKMSSSAAVDIIEEMAAAAFHEKIPTKQPTDLQESISIDDSINSPVSGLSFDALTPEEEVKFVDLLVASVPIESTPKKPLTVSEDIKKKISFDWNDDADIIAKAEEKMKRKEQEKDARNKTLNKTLSEASFAAKVRMSDVSINEEWQDDDYSHQKLQGLSNTLTSQDSFFARSVPTLETDTIEEENYDDKEVQLDGAMLRADYSLRDRRLTTDSAVLDAAYPVDEDDDDDDEEEENTFAEEEERPAPPSSLNIGGARPKQKKKVNIPAGLTLDMEAAADDNAQTPIDSAVLTPSSTEMSWEDETPISSKAVTPNIPAEPIPEYTAKEEFEDRHKWRKVSIGGREHTIDMNVINPYRKVLSHGGYYGDGLNAIIVFASCYMPDKTRKDYSYVMDNLFLYIVSTLELLVAQDYMIIYFHGAASRRKVPGMAWMRRCYRLVDRRLRKNLKGLYIVHPTMWLKTVVGLTKPFISAKFSSKLRFVYQLDELKQLVPMEYVYIPEEVKKFDLKRTQKGG
ncbi:uncharacterized protein [Antedon mediterranea]|uniref:uncharacterized protein isoform X2 n=1 Tax=Antedon mediterranea TaxID=105859 RepID=UPI003AF94152